MTIKSETLLTLQAMSNGDFSDCVFIKVDVDEASVSDVIIDINHSSFTHLCI